MAIGFLIMANVSQVQEEESSGNSCSTSEGYLVGVHGILAIAFHCVTSSSMKQQAAALPLLALAASLSLIGCGGGGDSSNSNSPASNNMGGPIQTNNPSSFAGKTYSFTVTSRQGLSEPVGATYTIDFTDSSYTFNPSPQNEERTNSVSGSYTYDPNTATVVLSATENVTGNFNFATPTSGTVHWSETDGEMQDADFNQL